MDRLLVKHEQVEINGGTEQSSISLRLLAEVELPAREQTDRCYGFYRVPCLTVTAVSYAFTGSTDVSPKQWQRKRATR